MVKAREPQHWKPFLVLNLVLRSRKLTALGQNHLKLQVNMKEFKTGKAESK